MQKSDVKLNRETYLDKVLGCWAGKNIGGTLGAPMEGRREIFHCDFYTKPMDGEPDPTTTSTSSSYGSRRWRTSAR